MGRPRIHKRGFNFNEYYEHHKDRINRRRRERYRLDPTYRNRVKQSNFLSYQKRKKQLKDRRVIKNKRGKFFSLGVLASNINRKPQTIRDYHKQGVIPEPTFYDTRGWRLYSEDQIALAKKLFHQYDEKIIDRKQLITELHERWTDGDKK